VEDDLSLMETLPVNWVWMFRHKPVYAANADGIGTVTAGKLTLRFSAPLAFAYKEIPVADARMAKSYPGSLYCVTLTAEPALNHNCRFLFARG